MEKVEIIVHRNSNEEVTFAKVTAEVESVNLMDDGNFLRALKTAVTSWVKDTEDGDKAWDASSNDFNIGDLSGYTSSYEDYPELKQRLEEQGIFNLEIEIHCGENPSPRWSYDEVLVDDPT